MRQLVTFLLLAATLDLLSGALSPLMVVNENYPAADFRKRK